MEKKEFGSFIKESRLKKGLTQQELADLLFIDVTAVSKWERGISFPDITLIPKLTESLGVTEHELITASVDQKSRDEKSQAKKWRAFSMSWSMFFYISYIIALIPCFICDLAINKSLTWFWIVLSALLLAFSFTNLPKLIKKHKLILVPLSMFLSLCLLLGVCCIYTKGDWFFVATIPVLLGLIIIFTPIYISKLKVFNKIRKFNDYISLGVDFIMLNILLIVCNIYSVANNYTDNTYWYFNIALPIVLSVYLMLNLLVSVKFLKLNKLLKTSIILTLIDMFLYIPPLFVKVKYPAFQNELKDWNIFKANFYDWNTLINNNIHCIIALTLLGLAILFVIAGVILHKKRKRNLR